jgi:hypothetical protein
MDIKEFKTWFDLVIGAVSSVGTALLLGYLNKKMQNKRAPVVIAIITVSVLIISANFLLRGIIDNSRSFRDWIDPNNIEGYWYETSPPDTNNLIKHMTIINIKYNKGVYEVFGETYDTLGKSYAYFQSSTSAFHDGMLFLQYTSSNFTHGIGVGFDQLQFSNPPNSFKGFIFSMTSKRFYSMEGHRLKDDQLKTYNYLQSSDHKKQFILDHLARLNGPQ